MAAALCSYASIVPNIPSTTHGSQARVYNADWRLSLDMDMMPQKYNKLPRTYIRVSYFATMCSPHVLRGTLTSTQQHLLTLSESSWEGVFSYFDAGLGAGPRVPRRPGRHTRLPQTITNQYTSSTSSRVMACHPFFLCSLEA